MSNQYPPVTIPYTEVRMLKSSHVDQEYKLFISLPMDYSESNTNYPTLYMLDPNWDFPSVAVTVHRLYRNQQIPKLLVVGIGYPEDDSNALWKCRTRDYTPTSNTEAEKHLSEELGIESLSSGGADSFSKFIKEELIPFVDQEYRTDTTDRLFWGHSFGGLFGLYTIFHNPATFNRYIISSPNLWWDDRITFTCEKQFMEKFDDLHANLFLSISSLEEYVDYPNVSNLYQFFSLLRSRNYESLRMKMQVFEEEVHGSVPPLAFLKGIRSVFNNSTSG